MAWAYGPAINRSERSKPTAQITALHPAQHGLRSNPAWSRKSIKLGVGNGAQVEPKGKRGNIMCKGIIP
jgi:hypothetical protein